MHTALSRLRRLDREVLLLSAWEDLAPSEIAVVMGCSQSSARGRLHRARRRFRDEYERFGPEADHHVSTEPDSDKLLLEPLSPERSVCDA